MFGKLSSEIEQEINEKGDHFKICKDEILFEQK